MQRRVVLLLLGCLCLASGSWAAEDDRVPRLVPLPTDTLELGGYRLGRYPEPEERGAAYAVPTHLTEVTATQADHRLSEHFRIGQFLCKQEAGWPRYVLVQPRLLQVLEAIVAELARRGQPVRTLAIMSGYRTPAYNRALGNVPYSRHIYGDAADIFVDEDGDGAMDDLDGNGRLELADALWLRDLIAQLLPAAEVAATTAGRAGTLPAGGLAAYGATAAHGPFVHVDARGYSARWGLALDAGAQGR